MHLLNPVYYLFNEPWLYNVPLLDSLQQNTFLFRDHFLHLLNPVYNVFNGVWLCNVPPFDRLRPSQWDLRQNMFLFQDNIFHLLNLVNYIFDGPWLCYVQTWNLSKILHRWIFRLKILQGQFHLIVTVLIRKTTKNEWKWRNLHSGENFTLPPVVSPLANSTSGYGPLFNRLQLSQWDQKQKTFFSGSHFAPSKSTVLCIQWFMTL